VFAEILKQYDELIHSLDSISIRTAIDTFRKINFKRTKLLEELTLQNKIDADQKARELVKTYVASGGDEDFFEQIAVIRLQTHISYNERFNNDCKYWEGIIDKKEEQFNFLLKSILTKKQIELGCYKNQKLLWTPIKVEPLQNRICLIMKQPVEVGEFHKRAYTTVEDEDEFGCAEQACNWKDSDICKYLNSNFFENVFSDEEKDLFVKTKRHINEGDYLIHNDISENYIFLLDLNEFLTLPLEIQICDAISEYSFWWLCEQHSRGWYETSELPKVYAVECCSAKLIDKFPNDIGLIRPCITVDLDKFIESEGCL